MPTAKSARTSGGGSTKAGHIDNYPRGEKEEIDSHGDIRLIAGSTEKIFVVSSNALSLASPVWRAMLSPSNGFRESTSDNVPLPDDNPSALRILLLIAHLQFQKIPKAVPLDDLHDLALLCDKYDTARLVKPFIAQWVHPPESGAPEPGDERWLSIAWVFGLGKIFVQQVNYLVLNLHEHHDDTRKRKRDIELSNIMPAGIIESIRCVRRYIVTKMLKVCYKYTDSFRPGNLGKRCLDSYADGDEKKQCDVITYGSFTLGLQQHGLWPDRSDAFMIGHSVEPLRKLLHEIEILQPIDSYHPECSFRSAFHTTIDKVYTSSDFRHSYKRHTFLNGLDRALKDPGGEPHEVLSRLGLSASDFDPDASSGEESDVTARYASRKKPRLSRR